LPHIQKDDKASDAAVDMTAHGVLNEGSFGLIKRCSGGISDVLDGIHVDMNHLKKGEVKWVFGIYI
jgi:hypothetical protein